MEQADGPSNDFARRAKKASKETEEVTLIKKQERKEDRQQNLNEKVTEKQRGVRKQQRVDHSQYPSSPKSLVKLYKEQNQTIDNDEHAQVAEVDNQDELKNVSRRSIVVFKKKRILHSQIINEYKGEMTLGAIIKRSGCSQNFVIQKQKPSSLEGEKEVQEYLKQNSYRFKSVNSIQLLSSHDEISTFTLESLDQKEVILRKIN